MSKPYLPNLEVITQTQIAPGVGVVKEKNVGCKLEEDMKRLLRVKDEQQFMQRFKWGKIPNIDANLMERMMYFKGQLMLFCLGTEENEKWFVLPYALNGDIDFYGRYKVLTPVPYASDKMPGEAKNPLSYIKRKVIYDAEQVEGIDVETLKKEYCIIIRDYSCQLSQNIIPRAVLQEGLISYQSEILPIMRTSLINSAGVTGMRVSSQDEQSNVKSANEAKVRSAKNGEGWIPIIGQVEFQDLNTASSNSPTDLLQSYQAVDNCRASFMGVGSGAVYQKNAHMLQDEEQGNKQSADVPLQDSLEQRKNACELAKLFGLNLTVEINQEMIQDTAEGDAEFEEEPEGDVNE